MALKGSDTLDWSLPQSATYSRVRTQDLGVITAPIWHVFITGGGGYHEDVLFRPARDVKQVKVMCDVVVPNFRKRSRNGEFFVNPMATSSTVVSLVPLTYTAVVNAQPYGAWSNTLVYTGQCIGVDIDTKGFTSSPVPDVSSTWDEALQKAYASVNGQCMQLLVDLAELHKTLALLEDLAAKSLQFLTAPDSLRRRTEKQVRNARRRAGGTRKGTSGKVLGAAAGLFNAAKGGSSLWLQYRYGIQPLMLSVRDARKAILQAIENIEGLRITGRGASNFDFQASNVLSGTTVGEFGLVGLNQPWSKTHTQNVSVRYRAGVTARVAFSANRAFGTDITSLPEATWELVPYSFVVDWFVNVGDWLRSLNLGPDVHILGSWVVETKVTVDTYTYRRFSCSVQAGSGSSAYSGTISGGSAYRNDTYMAKVRTPNVGRPILPSFRAEKLSLTHMVDSAALAFTPFRKFKSIRL